MQTEDEFYYGRRQIVRYDKTGQPSYTYLPLTLADFLNPQAGDEFVHSAEHEQTVQELFYCLRYHYRYNPAIGVLRGVKLIWPLPGLAQPAPDLAVVPNLTDPERSRPHFDVAAEGTQPPFILEVTSPRFARLDLQEKVAIYAQAGVREYFVVDTTVSPYRVLGYQQTGDSYTPIEPDAAGRIYSAVLRLWFTVNAVDDTLTLIDKRTGRPIVPDAEFRESLAGAQAEARQRATHIAAQLDFLHDRKG